MITWYNSLKPNGLYFMSHNQAVIKIQARVRGFFARKKYAYQPLPIEQQSDYNVIVPGNDPNITTLPHHAPTEQIALVATSGVRAVHMACELGGQLPKIFLVDNSRHVINYWHYIQEKMQTAKNKNEFFSALTAYSKRCVPACDIAEILTRKKYLKEDKRYYTFLFENFGFLLCKRIILNATVIPQSWDDKSTFQKIKNICAYLGFNKIYAYPSNIVSYLHNKNLVASARNVLENIQLLSPRLAFHSNLLPSEHGPCCYSPQNIITVNNHDIDYVTHKLGVDLAHESTAQKHMISVI